MCCTSLFTPIAKRTLPEVSLHPRDMVALSFVALSVGLLLPSPPGTLTLTRRDALAAVAATPALLARPAAAPAAPVSSR